MILCCQFCGGLLVADILLINFISFTMEGTNNSLSFSTNSEDFEAMPSTSGFNHFLVSDFLNIEETANEESKSLETVHQEEDAPFVYYTAGLINVNKGDALIIQDDGLNSSYLIFKLEGLEEEETSSKVPPKQMQRKKYPPYQRRVKYYQCPHCDYKGSRTGDLRNHIMAVHTKEKPHKCPQCDYRAVQLANLKRHIMAMHTNQKPRECPLCGYKTVYTSALKSHIMYHHTKEKPHECVHCDYKAVTAGTLKRHIQSKHPNLNVDQIFNK